MLWLIVSLIISWLVILSWLFITLGGIVISLGQQSLLLIVCLDPALDVFLSESLFVRLKHADKVSEDSIKKGSDEEAENNLLLSGHAQEANAIVTSGNLV